MDLILILACCFSLLILYLLLQLLCNGDCTSFNAILCVIMFLIMHYFSPKVSNWWFFRTNDYYERGRSPTHIFIYCSQLCMFCSYPMSKHILFGQLHVLKNICYTLQIICTLIHVIMLCNRICWILGVA